MKPLDAAFVAALCAWAAVLVFGQLIPDNLGFLGFLAAGLLVLATGLLALAVRASDDRPGRRRHALRIGGGLVLAAVLLVPLQQVGGWLFWRSHAAAFEQLTTELVQDGRIHDLTGGHGPYATLNNVRVNALATQAVDPTYALRATTWPLQQVLSREGLDRASYDRYRRKLAALSVSEVVITPDYVGYLREGMLDNLNGYLWVRPGHAPPAVDTELLSTQLISLRRVGGRWYRFGTT